MQFADPASAGHGYAEDLTAPQAMRSELPAGLPKARLVIACVLDRTGSAAPASSARTRHGSHDQQSPDRAQQLEVSVPSLRGNEPIEVNAILGFNIDTNDRF